MLTLTLILWPSCKVKLLKLVFMINDFKLDWKYKAVLCIDVVNLIYLLFSLSVIGYHHGYRSVGEYCPHSAVLFYIQVSWCFRFWREKKVWTIILIQDTLISNKKGQIINYNSSENKPSENISSATALTQFSPVFPYTATTCMVTGWSTIVFFSLLFKMIVSQSFSAL